MHFAVPNLDTLIINGVKELVKPGGLVRNFLVGIVQAVIDDVGQAVGH